MCVLTTKHRRRERQRRQTRGDSKASEMGAQNSWMGSTRTVVYSDFVVVVRRRDRDEFNVARVEAIEN